ncbi:MAG: metallophosphoesterase [Hyphomicrobiales bacterium]|nr:MAG: metallophosphoesterase [Hyphomicrobiales bacterium]
MSQEDGEAAIDVDGPLLVFGGPYSNLAATRRMQEVARDKGFASSQVICTGDIVAYCAEPEETTAVIRDWGCHVIAGNCEMQLAAGAADCGCGFEEGTACDLLSKGWYPFALSRMSREACDWMGKLPRTMRFSLGGLKFRAVHGGVEETAKFLFGSERAALRAELELAKADVVIGGHAGIPFIERVSTAQGPCVWFNAGVVGMPANDGTPDGWYGIIREVEGGVALETHRLAYDHGTAAAAMRRSGHANPYARALVTGLWPSLDILPEPERARTGRRLRAKRLVVQNEKATSDLSAIA